MIIPIVQRGSEILEKKCKKVSNFDNAKRVILDMRETIAHLKTTYDFSRGIGLSAPQIRELLRIAIIENKGQEYVLVNPEIIETSKEKHKVWEGCLSFFNFRANVPRSIKVKVKAYDENGKEYTIDAKNDFAASLQHEIDHLDGVLYIEKLKNGEKDLVVSNKA
jgi:peptide deformylase